MKKNKAGKKNKIYLYVIVLVILVVGAYGAYFQFMKKQQMQDTMHTPTTEAEKLIAKDLEIGYPETPKEVMKLFGRINQCINNKSLEDEEFTSLVDKMRGLYCAELKNMESNSLTNMAAKIKAEKDENNSHNRKIINYIIDDESKYRYKTIEGKETVYLHYSYFIRYDGDYNTVNCSAILMKEDGKWKIAGFKQSEEDQTSMTKKSASNK